MLEQIVTAALYTLMGITLFAALGAVLFVNLFHAALALAGVLMAVAAFYVALGAEFLAMVQILVYVGGVMTLIIYAIMLTGKMNTPEKGAQNRQVIPAMTGGLLLLALLSGLMLDGPWKAAGTGNVDAVTVKGLGVALMTDFVFPFEVLGFLLFAVLIGALVIARKEKV